MRGPTTDLKAQILERVTATPAAVWTPIDFLHLGARAAVDKVLQRLANSDSIERLDRGLYYLSHKNSLTGRISMPDTGAVIDAVGRRDQTRLLIDETDGGERSRFHDCRPVPGRGPKRRASTIDTAR